MAARNDAYTIQMAEKLVAKLRRDPEAVFKALGAIEDHARAMRDSLHAAGDNIGAAAVHDAARAINVVREWVPSW